eukprot:1156178-Pelagomonas_calceolata.AAC.2
MGPIGRGRGWWVVGGRSTFLGTPPGPLLQNSKHFIGFLSSRTGDWHPFSANWVKGGVCVHSWESVTCAQGVWAAGGVKVNVLQTDPNFQDSDNV